MTLRPFEDLIKPIEIDRETFVPIKALAKICTTGSKTPEAFGYNVNIIKSTSKKWRYFKAIIHLGKPKNYKFEFKICKDSLNEEIYFDVNVFFSQNGELGKVGYNLYAVQIVKNLIKWGFIEP